MLGQFEFPHKLLDVSRGQNLTCSETVFQWSTTRSLVESLQSHTASKSSTAAVLYTWYTGMHLVLIPGMFVGSSEGLPQRFICHQHQTESKIAVYVPAHQRGSYPIPGTEYVVSLYRASPVRSVRRRYVRDAEQNSPIDRHVGSSTYTFCNLLPKKHCVQVPGIIFQVSGRVAPISFST